MHCVHQCLKFTFTLVDHAPRLQLLQGLQKTLVIEFKTVDEKWKVSITIQHIRMRPSR